MVGLSVGVGAPLVRRNFADHNVISLTYSPFPSSPWALGICLSVSVLSLLPPLVQWLFLLVIAVSFLCAI